jgi:bifunctional non-homologous end joining protein LigD
MDIAEVLLELVPDRHEHAHEVVQLYRPLQVDGQLYEAVAFNQKDRPIILATPPFDRSGRRTKAAAKRISAAGLHISESRTRFASLMNHLAHHPTMQPTLSDTPPTGPGWLHEIKYDGYRTQVGMRSGHALAYSRNGHNWTTKYGPICEAAKQLPVISALIDGEVCVQDGNGVTDFSALPRAMAERPHDLVFFAFDLLHPDGVNLEDRPLEERRAKLRWLLDQVPGSRLVMSDEFSGDGQSFFKLADKHGLEGIVSKRKGSRYRSGSSRDWFKIKCWKTDWFEVIGVERDKEGVPQALLAQGGCYMGSAYLTLPGDMSELFWRWTERHEAENGPFRKEGASWVQPGLTAQVRFLKGSDKLRHAVVREIAVQ